jgi:hypothetical protein
MHAAEHSQEAAQPCACPFAGVAVDFPHAIAIVIARPLILTVIDRGVRELQPMITALLVIATSAIGCVIISSFVMTAISGIAFVWLLQRPQPGYEALETD